MTALKAASDYLFLNDTIALFCTVFKILFTCLDCLYGEAGCLVHNEYNTTSYDNMLWVKTFENKKPLFFASLLEVLKPKN